MCKLMFGEHREKITQIILTAVDENVCFALLKESLGEAIFSFFFFSFLFGSNPSMIKKQNGKDVAEVITLEQQ